MLDLKKIDILNKIREKLDLNISYLEQSTFSVYIQGANPREKPNQIGTAFLFEYRNTRYLATARHVIKQASNYGELGFLSKAGRFFYLAEVKSEDSFEVFDDDIDYHVIKLKKKFIDAMAILCNGEIAPAPRPYNLALTIGYPNSRNKTRIDKIKKTAAMTCLRLTLSELPSDGIKRRLPEYPHHFVLCWENKKLGEEWQEVDSIAIKGMSGAPCFYIPFSEKDMLSSVDQYEGVCLIGLLIEQYDDFVKFVRFEEILSHLNC